MEREQIYSVCRYFYTAMDVGVTVIDPQGEVIFQTEKTCDDCLFCRTIIENSGDKLNHDCAMSRLYGSYQAERFGGRYIFFCRLGFTHFASPVFRGDIKEYTLIGGPALMIDREEFFQEEILNKRNSHHTYDNAELWNVLNNIPYFSTEKTHSLSEMLFIAAEHLGDKNAYQKERYANQQLQGVISDYIMRIKNTAVPGFYPLEQEQKLLDAVSQGNVSSAKAQLNELLGSIFFYSGFKFDLIRSRIMELIVLLSRAAVNGGADVELIFGLNYVYLREIDNFKSIEELTNWLSMIMSRFTDNVFNFTGVKHSDIIFKATTYIKNHYMEKITLEVVAGEVFLSPPYFSKIFKEEVRCTFNHYLNKVRIDQSKRMLINKHIPLADVSSLVGYEDQSYFSKVFKKLTGLSPLKFRQSRGIQNK